MPLANVHQFSTLLEKSLHYVYDVCYLFICRMLPPESGSVYDFLYEKETQRWVSWHDIISQDRFTIPSDAKV